MTEASVVVIGGRTSVARGVRGFSGSALRRARQRVGLTADDLAALVQVSESSVLRWETGQARPTATRLRAIAEAVGVRIADLLETQPGTQSLRDLRESAGLSLSELSGLAGSSVSSLLRLERGGVALSDPLRGRLAEIYQVTVRDLEAAKQVSDAVRRRRALAPRPSQQGDI